MPRILTDKNRLTPVYGLLFGMPGVPCRLLRQRVGDGGRQSATATPPCAPPWNAPESNDLTAWITALAHARTQSKALCCGSYRNVLVQPKQLIFERYADGERVLVAINADGNPFTAHFDAGCGMAVDMITGAPHDFGGGSELAPYSVSYWKMER